MPRIDVPNHAIIEVDLAGLTWADVKKLVAIAEAQGELDDEVWLSIDESGDCKSIKLALDVATDGQN